MGKHLISASFGTAQRNEDGKYAAIMEMAWSDGTTSEGFSIQHFDNEDDAWGHAQELIQKMKDSFDGIAIEVCHCGDSNRVVH